MTTTPPTLSLAVGFGTGGVATVNTINSVDTGPYVAYDNATIVAAASGESGGNLVLTLVRLDAAGALLATQAHTVPVGNLSPLILGSGIRDMVVTNDGKIVVAFYAYYTLTPDLQYLWVGRYNADFTLDATWNAAGLVTSAPGYFAVQIGISPVGPPLCLSLMYDGTVGVAFTGLLGVEFGRIASDGASMASSVEILLLLGTAHATCTQPDGKLLVTTAEATGIRLWRRLNDATVTADLTFGGGTGSVFYTNGPIASVPTNICVDASGRIYVGLNFTANNFFGVVRFLSGGTLDGTFGVGGLATGSLNKSSLGLTMLHSQGVVAIGCTPLNSNTHAIGFGSTGTAGTLFTPAVSVGTWVNVCTGGDGSIFAGSLSLLKINVTKIATDNGGAMPTSSFAHPTAGQIPAGQPFDGSTVGVSTLVALSITGNPTEWGQSDPTTGAWSLPNSLPVGPAVYTFDLASMWVGRRFNQNITTTATVILCLHGDSLITLADGGKKRLKNIDSGDSVLGADGKAYAVDQLVACWLKDPSTDTAPRAVVVKPGAYGEGLPTERLIIDIGHPVGRVTDYLEGGLQGLRPLSELLATLPASEEKYFTVLPWERVHEWTGEKKPVEKRFDLVLEGGPAAYIANGLAVRSRDSDKVAGYMHDPEEFGTQLV